MSNLNINSEDRSKLLEEKSFWKWCYVIACVLSVGAAILVVSSLIRWVPRDYGEGKCNL